jgi:hypothetical protein
VQQWDYGIDDSNKVADFCGASFTPPSSIVFSGSADDEKLSAIHDSFLVAINSSSSIYFQNVNRLRSKTSDLFGAVILEVFDVVVYRVSTMHGSRQCTGLVVLSTNASGLGAMDFSFKYRRVKRF